MKQLDVESDDTRGNQFVKNATLGECLRHIQKLMWEEWDLRPLECEILLTFLLKFEKEKRQREISNKIAKNTFDGVLGRLGVGK